MAHRSSTTYHQLPRNLNTYSVCKSINSFNLCSSCLSMFINLTKLCFPHLWITFITFKHTIYWVLLIGVKCSLVLPPPFNSEHFITVNIYFTLEFITKKASNIEIIVTQISTDTANNDNFTLQILSSIWYLYIATQIGQIQQKVKIVYGKYYLVYSNYKSRHYTKCQWFTCGIIPLQFSTFLTDTRCYNTLTLTLKKVICDKSFGT